MTNQSRLKLFTPVHIGAVELKHRVVMAPLTRSRSVQPGNIPGDLMLEYYTQRASAGGFIVSEATSISVSARGWYGAPGRRLEEDYRCCACQGSAHVLAAMAYRPLIPYF